MEHLTECEQIKPFWNSCFRFTQRILGHPPPFHRKKAIILGQWGPTSADPLGPEDARAFLRHAFGAMYHDFANVDLKDIPFDCDHAYYSTLLSFQKAVLRKGHGFTLLYNTRFYTSLPGEVPENERNKYPCLLTCHAGGRFELNTTFTDEIARAKTRARHP